jgi:protein-S-isoprenylcysteine O-methyltransferase Ste14
MGSAAAERISVERKRSKAPAPVTGWAHIQKQSTGIAGTISILTLYVAYSNFQDRLSHGGPDWNTLWGFHKIARDYVDILLCVLVAFAVMVTFEKAQPVFRWAALAIMGATAGAVGLAPRDLWAFADESISAPELEMGAAFLIIALLLGLDLWIRIRTGVAKRPAIWRDVSWKQARRSGFMRWFALWCVFDLALVVYLGSKLYSGLPPNTENYYLNWRVTAVGLWGVFSILGLPYCILTVKYRSCFKEDRGDSGLILNLVALRTWQKGPKELWRLLKIRRLRVVLLDLQVKFFWAPLMVTFLFSECGGFQGGMAGAGKVFNKVGILEGLGILLGAFFSTANEAFLNDTYHMLYHSLFVVDCTLALLGYCTSSRWLGTKTKSVEFTALGWGAALACYPPFNSVTGTLFPYDVNPGPTYWVFATVAAHHLFMLLTLMLFFVYVWATVAFGLRFSNVTHRGILDTGPYRYIRHPAYATKNLAWWTESLGGFGNPWQFVYLAGLNAIYITRAITEERHLSHFQDYRDYMQRVRWRFIPGVF